MYRYTECIYSLSRLRSSLDFSVLPAAAWLPEMAFILASSFAPNRQIKIHSQSNIHSATTLYITFLAKLFLTQESYSTKEI